MLTLILVFASFCIHSTSKTSESFIYGGCSQQKYAPGTPLKSNLDSLLTSIVNSAVTTSSNNFTINTFSGGSSTVQGIFQCRFDMHPPDCYHCITDAVSQLGRLCPDSIGGAIQLQNCYVRYDNNTFLGVLDKNLMYKKCSDSYHYDTEILRKREDVLSGLASGTGSFRTGTSGDVQGLAQCISDLDGRDCSDCLMEAIRMLRSECSISISGDVYLGKCFARYSAGERFSEAVYSHLFSRWMVFIWLFSIFLFI